MDIYKEIRTLLRRFYGKEPSFIYKRLKELLLEQGVYEEYKDNLKDMLKETEAKIREEYTEKYTGGEPEIKAASKIIENIDDSFTRIDKEVVRKVSEAYTEGIKNNADWKDVARKSLRALRTAEHHIETELITTQAALDNTVKIANLRNDDEDSLLLYEGASPQRKFCRDHYGRVFKLSEVEQMVNSFNQPAMYYCGGYRCKHRWVKVRGSVEYEDETGGKVVIEKGYTESKNEMYIAKERAKLGNTVILQKVTNTSKSSDTIENGERIEYKTITNEATNIRTAVNNALRKGKKQAKHVLLYFENSNINLIDITIGIKKSLNHDESGLVNKVSVMIGDEDITKTKEEWYETGTIL